MSFPNQRTKVISGREARRHNERKERHAIAELPEWKKREMDARAEAIARLSKNGITPQDLEDEYKKGWKEGFANASSPVIRTCYAAICLAMKELHGFGKKRCMDVLNLVDEKITYSLTSEEAIDEVWKTIGLQINFKEPFDRISETED